MPLSVSHGIRGKQGAHLNQGEHGTRLSGKCPLRSHHALPFSAMAPPPSPPLPSLSHPRAGGEGGPDLNDTLRNLGINGGSVAVLGFLLLRELGEQKKEEGRIEREEALALLQVCMPDMGCPAGPTPCRQAHVLPRAWHGMAWHGMAWHGMAFTHAALTAVLAPARAQISLAGRVVPLASFRGTARPVIVTGSKSQVARALAASEPLAKKLRARGVCVVPVVVNDEEDPMLLLKKLKREFGGSGDAGGGASEATAVAAAAARSKGFGEEDPAPKPQAAPKPVPLSKKVGCQR